VGSRLDWMADDPAPLRPAWSGLIVLGFLASAAGLYLAFANQAHARAVKQWLEHATVACVQGASSPPNLANLNASSTALSVQVGVVALVFIVGGVLGAVVERRRTKRGAH
jgi:hypothetical protein